MREHLQKSYLELFELAPKLGFSPAEIEAQRSALKRGKDVCLDRFENHAKQYGKQIDAARNNLKKNTATLTGPERKQAHCNIQNLDLLKSEAELLEKQAIPTAYDNLSAKLDVIKLWPAEYRQIQQEIASGSYHTRRWGDVNDIEFREIEPNQQDDIKRGAQAVEQMKRLGLMPPAVEEKAIQEYARSVAERVARFTSRYFNLAKLTHLRCPGDTSLSSVGCSKRPTTSPNLPVSLHMKLRMTQPATARR